MEENFEFWLWYSKTLAISTDPISFFLSIQSKFMLDIIYERIPMQNLNKNREKEKNPTMKE